MTFSVLIGFAIWSVFISQISVALQVLLLLFSVSALSLAYLNSVRKSSQLIFIFPVCCHSSSSIIHPLVRDLKIWHLEDLHSERHAEVSKQEQYSNFLKIERPKQSSESHTVPVCTVEKGKDHYARHVFEGSSLLADNGKETPGGPEDHASCNGVFVD